MSEHHREPEVAAYAIKILPFWPSDPMLWLMQAEGQLNKRGITAEVTMFDHVLANFSQEITKEVRDLLMNPHDKNHYDISIGASHSKDHALGATGLQLHCLAPSILEIRSLLNCFTECSSCSVIRLVLWTHCSLDSYMYFSSTSRVILR